MHGATGRQSSALAAAIDCSADDLGLNNRIVRPVRRPKLFLTPWFRGGLLPARQAGLQIELRANPQSEPGDLLVLEKRGHIAFVRKNASRGGNKDTLPRSVFRAPAFGGGFFLSECPEKIGLRQRGRPPFPLERRPNSLVFALRSP